MENALLKDPEKFLEFLQTSSHVNNRAEAEKVANIIAWILKNIGNVLQWNHVNNATRQTTLSLAFRTYKKIVSNHNLKTENIVPVDQFEKIAESNQIRYEMLHVFLQTEDIKSVEAELLIETCFKGLNNCQTDQQYLIYTILRTINVLLKKHPHLEPRMKLNQVYALLQMNQHVIREEILMLFGKCCKSLKAAIVYFQFILEYYPWTHRNKYLLLSCILQNSHSLDKLLQHAGQNSEEFFNGLRLSLAYKRLHSPSQYLVKALSRQESVGLLELAANILSAGTFKEITNFHSNWFNRISQKEALLQFLYERLDIEVLLNNFAMHINATEEYRFVLIFSMYCRQILNTSKLDFFRISTELITNCFRFQVETQLFIYKFVVDNLNCFALEDILEYLADFIVEHRNVENAQLRNNILCKISNIINYVAKAFRKTHKKKMCDDSNTLKTSISDFFSKLNQLIENEIENKIYQPKIYTLKLLEVLLKSLFQEREENGEKIFFLEKNAKNCNVIENELLGKFLISKRVFNSGKFTTKLIEALNDPTGFDDALDLIVQLLKRMPPGCMDAAVVSDVLARCKKCCESIDIDECNLSTRYAVVALNVDNEAEQNFLTLQEYAFNKLHSELASFQADPLNSCKTRCHIFGLINVTVSYSKLVEFESSKIAELLDLLELIVNLILKLLQPAPATSHKNEAPVAASFQDMDKSLENLVKNSSFRAENNEECRKFLLMSFWLTLKACCDAATTLGTIYADHEKDEIDFEKLQRCFNINVTVLTRCRHKGAIEAAGVSIGKLTQHITSHKTQLPIVNKMLCDALSLLLLNENLVSTTRRGAGFSIMFLHVVKNDKQIEKPILRHAIREIFQLLRRTSNTTVNEASNCDRIEALSLHYLCVLSKDAELRDAVAMYRNEIILAAISKIDDPEWTICNAALQLFGALIPKIVGQKQATELEVVHDDWEPAYVSFVEIANSMPETFEHILNYCREHASESRFTRSIILFLGFLSKLEHLAQEDDSHVEMLLFRLRELMWSLLQHREEKVRHLSALVFVRAHEFHYELPQALLTAANLLFTLQNENFFEGLLFVIQAGVLKIRTEALHTIKSSSLTQFLQNLRSVLCENYSFKKEFKLYTQSKLLEMLLSVGFECQSILVADLLKSLSVNGKQTNFTANIDELLKKFDSSLNEEVHKAIMQ